MKLELENFIKENNCDYTNKRLNKEQLNDIQEKLKTNFGNELTDYLLEYGYLAYNSIELYGLNTVQLFESDLYNQTKYLHEYFPITESYIVIEKYNEHSYILIDNNDNIYNFNTINQEIINLNIKLYNYIMMRFNGEI